MTQNRLVPKADPLGGGQPKCEGVLSDGVKQYVLKPGAILSGKIQEDPLLYYQVMSKKKTLGYHCKFGSNNYKGYI